MLDEARKREELTNLYPLISHYGLRFSLDGSLHKTWELDLRIAPTYNTKEGLFFVGNLENEGKPLFFNDVNIALDFYIEQMQKYKPINWFENSKNLKTMITQLKNIELASKHDNLKFGLDAHFKTENKAKPTILFIHGFNGFKDWGHFNLIADYFAQEDFTFVKFNLSHNGTSLENPTEFVNLEAFGHEKYTTDLDDIESVIDYLHSDNCEFKTEMNLEEIYLIGHSRGGALVMLKACEDKRVKKVVTWAGVHTVYRFWSEEHIKLIETKGVVYRMNGRTKQNMPIYKAIYDDILENAERLDIKKQIKTLQIPILITHGDNDTSVSIDSAYQYQKYQPNVELFIIEEANHTFGGKHPYTEEELPKWTKILVEKTKAFLEKR